MLRAKPRKLKGLFWKLFLVSVLCMAIPMMISLVTTSYFSEKYLSDSASSGLTNIASEKKNQIELALSDLEKQAQSIAMQPCIVESLSVAIANTADPNQSDLHKISNPQFFRTCYFFNDTGICINVGFPERGKRTAGLLQFA